MLVALPVFGAPAARAGWFASPEGYARECLGRKQPTESWECSSELAHNIICALPWNWAGCKALSDRSLTRIDQAAGRSGLTPAEPALAIRGVVVAVVAHDEGQPDWAIAVRTDSLAQCRDDKRPALVLVVPSRRDHAQTRVDPNLKAGSRFEATAVLRTSHGGKYCAELLAD